MEAQTKTPDSVEDAPSGDRVADAAAGNWVDRLAPPATRPYLRLSRADRPIGTWLLLLPCWWGVGLAMIAYGPRLFDIWIVIACAVGAFVMRGAGCTWNDITDRDIDAQVARTRSRPLPSGRVSLRAAYAWMIAQSLIGFVILLTLGPAAIWLGIASLALVAIYPFAKRFTWWPQLFLGFAFNWGVMLAYAAHAGRLDFAPFVAWLGGIAWTIFYDTIYAHQDAEDDALIGVKSTARLWGDDSPRWLARFAALALAILTVAMLLAARGEFSAALIGLAGIAGFGAHLLWQMHTLDTADGALCLRLFKSNRDAGLILALFLAIAGIV
ncbi:4-hydroxybenzoate octaprenyltransferase [Paracoccus sp. TK19116]|uniref:4-hydroxybenzoate octaprenyltransferase n=1 Tax=Paracoccus albicereus TaxID=2922394 RepID=A0ABT1MST5_9RHOB|nr:4-hydroxybenzoate octaprenyltransferase [Paracoccus albicereus]MCQ0971375.1 4-hydroxybenzoate octaprenyltransferase [Paracoccus albicereus]